METKKEKLNDKQKAFLKAFVKLGVISKSAKEAGINRNTVRRWVKSSTTNFADKYEEAKRDFTERLELNAFGRVFEQGANANPALLIHLLKAHLPEKYGPISTATEESKDMIRELKATASKQRKEIDRIRDRIPAEDYDGADRLVQQAEKIISNKARPKDS